MDVDDGNGKEDQGDRGAEEEARTYVQAVEEEAAEYRRLRDRAQLRPKKMDRRLLPMTQLEIMLGNHWKERVRGAYDTAAELADELAESYKENEEFWAKFRELELESPPSPLVEQQKNLEITHDIAPDRSRAVKNTYSELDFCTDSTYDGACPGVGVETSFPSELGLL